MRNRNLQKRGIGSFLPAFVLLIALFLTSCNLPTSNMSAYLGPAVWIDAPKSGMHLPIAPYQIVMHGSDNSDVSQYEIYINDELLARINAASRGLPALQYAEYNWEPQIAGEYNISIRGQNTNGQWGNEDSVVVFVGDFTKEPIEVTEFTPITPQTPTPINTDTPTATETLTITATPADTMATFHMNANCRLGPSTEYDVVTSLLAGEEVKVIAYNDDNVKWFYIQLPNSTARCWVSSSTVNISGDENGVPYYIAPERPPTETPTPTLPTPTPTTSYIPYT